MRRAVLAGLVLLGPASLSAQDVSVFAPGRVSVQGDNVYRGVFAPDGDTFLFFRKVTDGAEDYRIYQTTRGADGWSAPTLLSLGAEGTSDLYPAISPDGRTLVFTSYRPFPGDTGSSPNANLWRATRSGAGWSDPEPLTALSVPARYEAGPWFDGDGVLHWVSVSPDWQERSPRRARSGADGWEADDLMAPWRDWRDDVRVWGGRPSPDGTLMVLDVSQRDGRRWGPSDLWVSVRMADGWSTPHHLGPAVNTPDDYENFVVFTPDGSRMLFVRGFQSYHAVPVVQIADAARSE